jgi:hypothetical protein
MPRTVKTEAGDEVTVYTQKELDDMNAAARYEGKKQSEAEITKLKDELSGAQKAAADNEIAAKKATADADKATQTYETHIADLKGKAEAAEFAAKKATAGNATFKALAKAGLPTDMAEFLVDHPSFAVLDLSTEEGKDKFETEMKLLMERSPNLFTPIKAGDAADTPPPPPAPDDLGSGSTPQPGKAGVIDAESAATNHQTWMAQREKILKER